ncbi:hypothetical protein D081_1588 [Anaerovibrio sp. JC8]|uniref:DUF4867 family protein n=1 Tax=Anaerovibrio sp. JC8 TaxID=1240085 RepID=UPI000A09A269|nr:DUF4867 family protein [Anaerovibrio sp. JC8]ORU00009.1 hypothetical protein D081_1588 [Anaerovibrio sp. JC8]
MKSVMDEAFRKYGRVMDMEVSEFITEVEKLPEAPQGEVLYEASIPEFETTKLFLKFMDEVYGGMPIEFGCCYGFNDKLNGLEYHRDSEINIAGTDMILMVGHRWDIDYEDNSYDTSKVEAFFVPKGTVVEIYATTLHYAPCGVDGKEFRSGVVLPGGTNEALDVEPEAKGESAMLFAINKWLLVHPESGESGRVGTLKGKNLSLQDFE